MTTNMDPQKAMADALEECGQKFREYQKLHEEKLTESGRLKALANAEMAIKCERIVAAYRAQAEEPKYRRLLPGEKIERTDEFLSDECQWMPMTRIFVGCPCIAIFQPIRRPITPDEPKYRMLKVGEKLEAGDEWNDGDNWRPINAGFGEAAGLHEYYRRPITPEAR